jgi:hypothetical protein
VEATTSQKSSVICRRWSSTGPATIALPQVAQYSESACTAQLQFRQSTVESMTPPNLAEGTIRPFGIGDEDFLDLDPKWGAQVRNNQPRIGRVLIARGRDAADVAITTTFGPNTLKSFRVWTDEVLESAHLQD